jgi:integrase
LMPDALDRILRQYLMNWKPNPRGLLFANSKGNPYSANNIVQRRLWPILDALGIPRCGMHAFRHSAATFLASSGVSPKIIQEQLRHASTKTTMDMYVHNIGPEHRAALENFASVLDGCGRKLAGNSLQLN